MLNDLRYALRMLLESPGFTAAAIVALALGIGANASIFSILNDLLLRRLPVPQAQQVVAVYRGSSEPWSYRDYLDCQDRNRVFMGLLAYLPVPTGLDVENESEIILAEAVSGNYASVLEVKPALGRWFIPEDDRLAGGEYFAVISYGVWQRRFGGNPQVVGKQVRTETQRYTVIGVAPKAFKGTFPPYSTDLWVPLVMYGNHNQDIRRMLENRDSGAMLVLGRLKPSVTPQQAQAFMNTLDHQLRKEYPRANPKEEPLSVKRVQGVSFPGSRRLVVPLVALLMAVVGLVLLIACVNVANLLLARATVRRREIAIRLALGASRGRLIQQSLIESVLLALFGAMVGLLFALWTNHLLESLIPSLPAPMAVRPTLSLDWPVLAFTFVLSLLTVVVFGLAPALESSKPDLVPALKQEINTTATRSRRFRLRNVYVVAQVALSLVLLIASSLFLRALQNATRINPGFNSEKRLFVRLYISPPEFTLETGREFYRQVLDRVRGLPAVENASLANFIPLESEPQPEFICLEVGDSSQEPWPMGASVIETNYFSTMGIPLLRGRDFGPQDNPGAPRVAIINETMAHRYWPNQDPIGKRFRTGRECDKGRGMSTEIVGIARDGKYNALTEAPQPHLYLPFAQHFQGFMALLVQTAVEPKAAMAPIRQELVRLDRNIRIYQFTTLTDHVATSFWEVRWQASVLGAFGLLALLLASMGLYGVMAYSVAQRTHEIGVRMALGAQSRDVQRLIVRQAMGLTLTGIGLGLALSLAVTRFLIGFLYGLSPTDPVAFVGAVLLWTAVALLASYCPARRATKVDPMVALRYE